MQKLLTIVVPVYKVEPYINKCLDSCILEDEKLMSQLEVIIVNDGTPDNSAEMSREYVKRYPKTFRQIDKENGGHGSAWNVGLKEATGKYLRFLDSDDWLTNLDMLMAKLQKTDADLVFTPIDVNYVGGDIIRTSIIGPLNVETPITDFAYQENNLSICDFQYCTYKRTLLQPLYPLFDEHVFYDDMILFVVPPMFAKYFVIYDFPLYQYLMGRAGQTMDPKVMSRNGRYMIQQYQKMLSYRDAKELKPEIASWVNHILTQYAQRELVPILARFGYKQAKTYGALIKKIILSTPDNLTGSKQVRRFISMPFCLFCLYEKIRNLKNG